nr:putative lipoprotein lipase [Ipomoea batatas]
MAVSHRRGIRASSPSLRKFSPTTRTDLRNPKFPPAAGYGLNPNSVVKRARRGRPFSRLIVVNHTGYVRGNSEESNRVFCGGAVGCMSLNLAVKYADVIHSIVLQNGFKVVNLGSFLKLLDDADVGGFLQKTRAEKALQRLKEMSGEDARGAPKLQKMERQQTFERQHKDAMERAVSLKIPHAVVMGEVAEGGVLEKNTIAEPYVQSEDVLELKAKFFNSRTNWHEVVEKLFKKDESGQLLLHRDPTAID